MPHPVIVNYTKKKESVNDLFLNYEKNILKIFSFLIIFRFFFIGAGRNNDFIILFSLSCESKVRKGSWREGRMPGCGKKKKEIPGKGIVTESS